jgi:AcrR family transcriptional regulator
MNRAELHEPRKRPKQRRSKITVDAILEATARVLVHEGYEKASTNRIAKVAGVSIGSLYQYFPSKESLVLALIEQHCEHMLKLLVESSVTLATAPLDEAIRTYVKAMLAAHAVDPALHRVLMTEVMHLGLERLNDMEAQARAILKQYLDQRRGEILPQDTYTAAFVLVSAVEAITYRAMIDAKVLTSQALEDEICALVLRYLVGTPELMAADSVVSLSA